jgi:uncharacterized membrane protein
MEDTMSNPETQSIMIKADAQELYALWANLEHFPSFMRHIVSVEQTGDHTSHWVMQDPSGNRAEWDLETTRADESRRIAWNSREGGDVKTSGQITFTPLPQGVTEVTVTRTYTPQPESSERVGNLFADSAALLTEDLRNFKAYAEGRHEHLPA